MLLINTQTYELEEFQGAGIPGYAILSHTWGKPCHEVTYADLQSGQAEAKEAYNKIQFLCEQAAEDRLSHAWCDTCCIDKTSSAELTEALNSMYRFYKKGSKCYALLADVDSISSGTWQQQFRNSKWFKRCWTLQELLAPAEVEFYSKDRVRLGNKSSLVLLISQTTGISTQALLDNSLQKIPMIERLSWTQSREATREEDEAYSLFGILDISMPVIYGEQRRNAFRRLYKEIMENFKPAPGESTEQLRLYLQALTKDPEIMNTPSSTQKAQETTPSADSSQSATLSQGSFREYMASYDSDLAGAALRSTVHMFRSTMHSDDYAYYNGTTYGSIKKELMMLQRDQEKRRVMMNLSRLRIFLERLQHLNMTIECLNILDFSMSVWGPIKFVLLTTSAVPDAFETVLCAFEQIGSKLPCLTEYDALCTVQRDVVNFYSAIFEFLKRIVDMCRTAAWTRLFKPLWKGYGTEFSGLVLRLAAMTRYVEDRILLPHHTQYRSAMTENMAKLQQEQPLSVAETERYERTRKALKLDFETEERAYVSHKNQYEREVMELKDKVEKNVASEKSKQLKTVKEWLALEHHAELDHERFQNIRTEHPNTAQWILDHEKVADWINADVPSYATLWMHGIPGAGKTILSSSVIDRCAQREKFATCYFYCHEGDQSSNSALCILKGLIYQLLRRHKELVSLCHARRSLSGDATLRSLDQARKLFEDCCFARPNIFLVVDGLDECDVAERKQAIEILGAVAAQCNLAQPGTLRALFVSQDYVDIRKTLHSDAQGRVAPHTIPILVTDVARDIETYVKHWVDQIAAKFHEWFTEELKEYLRNLTNENAKGMMLYAELVLQNLHGQLTLEDLSMAIHEENFPKRLEDAYERILQRIKKDSTPEEWQKAKKLLGWMVCAKRQLAWKEIQVALSIDVESQEILYDDRRLRKHIHDICGSLVLLTGDRVTLVHSTAKTFIVNISEGIHEPTIECELATLCLQYLTFPCFSNDNLGTKELENMMLNGHFAFQDYAVAKWFQHINAFISRGAKFMKELEESKERAALLENLSTALDDFMSRYDDENWSAGLVQDCHQKCSAFKDEIFFENLTLLASHIYTFQQKGFEARHKISIKDLETALKRNRKLLEKFPSAKDSSGQDKKRYFSEGFGLERDRKRHVNIHDRPFQCEVIDCLGGEGFPNSKDLQKHIRAFHPELSDFSETFNSIFVKREKAVHACTMCGKTFTRKFHKNNHEQSHRGERPHSCPECGRAFTRKNDMQRHRKLHERGR